MIPHVLETSMQTVQVRRVMAFVAVWSVLKKNMVQVSYYQQATHNFI